MVINGGFVKISIVATFKNEEPYILEWIAYHKSIGIDHFFIANNNSSDNTLSLLKKLEVVGVLTCIDYPTSSYKNNNPQVNVYNFLYDTYKDKSDWFLFIDGDEFVVLEEKFKSLKESLNHVLINEKVGCIVLYWALYGSSGRFNEVDGFTIEKYQFRESSPNIHYKSLIRKESLDYFFNPHAAKLKSGYTYVNSEGITLDQSDLEGISHYAKNSTWKNARINHYVVRSLEEFKRRKQPRGLATNGTMRANSFFNSHDKNQAFDPMQTKIVDAVIVKYNELIKLIDMNFYKSNTIQKYYSVDDKIRYHIDSIENKDGNLIINGWIINFYTKHIILNINFIDYFDGELNMIRRADVKNKFNLDHDLVGFRIFVKNFSYSEQDYIFLCLNPYGVNIGYVIDISNN